MDLLPRRPGSPSVVPEVVHSLWSACVDTVNPDGRAFGMTVMIKTAETDSQGCDLTTLAAKIQT